MSTPIIELENIELKKEGKRILSIDQLAVYQGEIIGVVGPNGAGKSTLLKVMSFLEMPTSGDIYFRQEKINSRKVKIDLRRQISIVFQQPLMLDTTVFQNVAISLKLRKLPKALIHEKVHYWLKQFDVEHLANRFAKTLSGGEMQRVALARAMVSSPSILFLDEPFSALDLPTRKKLLQDFKEVLAKTNTTAIFISHDFNEIKYLCNEMIVVYHGEILKRTSTKEFSFGGLPASLIQFLKDWMTPLV